LVPEKWYIWEPELLRELEEAHYARMDSPEWVIELREWVKSLRPKWLTLNEIFDSFEPLLLTDRTDGTVIAHITGVLEVLGWEHTRRRVCLDENGWVIDESGSTDRAYVFVPPVGWKPKLPEEV
jgi:hypothetical protein